jgi:hypothetical protein
MDLCATSLQQCISQHTTLLSKVTTHMKINKCVLHLGVVQDYVSF